MTDAPYRRSTGTARGEARKQDLLAKVVDDLAENGLVDFSLRRAARAAGTTHKVLLYYFDGVEDLLVQAVLALRERRIGRGLAAAARGKNRSMSQRIRAIWPVLVSEESWVLDQAIGLAMYDAKHYAALADDASTQYLPALISLCPPDWPGRRKREVSHLVLATLRGLLIEWRTRGDQTAIDAGLRALTRMLDREVETD